MRFEDIKNITVVGVGDMGHGIAQIALMNGFTVSMYEQKQEFVDRAESRIYSSLEKLASKGRIDASVIENGKKGKLKKFTDLKEATADADLIFEVVPEVLSIKQSVLKAIDEAAPEKSIIASNTSTMSISLLAESTNRADRMVGMHFFNPAVLMKLVEVIKGDKTTEETLDCAIKYVEAIGKVLVVAYKDRPGFIANRIAAPTVVFNGLQLDVDGRTPEDIDISMMKSGQKMGPFEVADFSGIQVMNACQLYYHEHLDSEYAPSKAAQKLFDEGKLGKQCGQGYYTWPEKGRPVIDESKWTGTYDPNLFYFIQANEATKLYEEGVCSFEDCDKAMEYGYNTPGPINYIREFNPEVIATSLQSISDKYGLKIFAPTETIRKGLYK